MAKAIKKDSAQIKQKKIAEKVSFNQRPYFWYYVIFAFAFLLFANSIPNEYAMDDELVTINHRLTSKGITAIPEIFTSPYYEDAAGYSFEYRPMVLASFAIEHSLFGENPHVSHLINVLLYALSCVLLFRVLKELFREYSVYLVVGVSLLFAAHTAHTEVVCNIKCRDEILALFFSLLAFQFSIKAITRNWMWLLLVAVIFTLALMSKVSVMPFVMLIPILMILFTSVSLWQVVAITFSLSLPSFFFIINVGSTDVKVIMLVACFLVNVAFFIFVNYKDFISRLKRAYWSNLQQVDTEYTIDLKTFFRGFLPDKSLFRLSAILPVLLLLGVYLGGAYMSSYYISVAAIVLLTGGYLLLNEQYKIWFLLALLMVGLVIIPKEDLVSLFLLFLVFAFLYGGKFYRLPIMLYFSFFLLRSEDSGNVAFLLVLLLFMCALRSRFSLMALITSIILVAIVNAYVYIEERSWTIDRVDIAIIYTFVIIYFKKDKRLVLYPLLLIVIGVTISNILNNQDAVQYVQQTGLLFKEPSNTDLIPAGSNRILAFPEQCLQNDDPWQVRAGTSLTILWHYLCKVIIPYPLAYYYGYKFIEPTPITESLPIITILLYLLLGLISLLLCRKEKLLTAGILTYLITIVVFSNYFAPIPGMVGDRFLLVPSLGWILVVAFLLSKIFKINFRDPTLRSARIPKTAKYTFGALLLFYSVLSFARNHDWHDAYTLYSHDISYVDNSAQAHNLLALTCLKNANVATSDAERLKLYEEGIHHLKRAVDIYPNFFNPTFDLGRAYGNIGQWDSARYYYDRTIALNDSFTDALYVVGDILRQQGKYEDAKPYFTKAIRYVPNEYLYYDKLSFIYFLQKQYDTAISINQQATVVIPNDPRPYYAIARIYFMDGKRDSSILYLNKVFERDPASALGLQLKAEMGLP